MAEFTPHSLQLIPYDGGLPGCVYSHWPASGRAMSPETLRSALDFFERVGAESPVRITFTGEEPMLAGTAWFAEALPLLRARFGSLAQMVISSGLQALDEDMLALLAAHDVHVEVRLDAFPAMHDAQNGAYAFEKTFAAVCRLREKDLPFHCTCTVTADFWKNAKGIALFFAEQNLPFTIWPAVPQMNAAANCRGRVLCPSRAGVFFRELLMVYRHGLEACDNETLNAMASACQQGRNSRKPFHGCFGTVAAIGPDGLVYPCWRFYHHMALMFNMEPLEEEAEDVLVQCGYVYLIRSQNAYDDERL
ncbi:hypothetical protein LJC49_06300 [Ruminococcaceae bacterium OttesenSCG-928-I18]|nr:hypothetical protein [Ruminococcaceae bacterium OttesenSCG-928-I18]